MSSSGNPVQYPAGADPASDSGGGTDPVLSLIMTIIPYSYADTFPLLLYTGEINEWIDGVANVVVTPFDVPVAATIGEVGNVDFLMEEDDADLQQELRFEVSPSLYLTADTELQLYLAAPGATEGAGHIVLLSRRSV